MDDQVHELFTLVGLLLIVKWIKDIIQTLYVYLTLATNEIFTPGKWAVVTGCTGGIGREYALQLGAKGLNVCLVSRNKKSLDELASVIRQQYGVRTQVIQTDFSSAGDDHYNAIRESLKDLDIDVLVNNVGVSNSKLDLFLGDTFSGQTLSQLIRVNMIAMAKMTQLVLPRMVKRRRGLVINLGSGTARQPFPYLAMYAATKAFVDMLSRSLSQEYKRFGVSVQCVTPYFVSTAMSKHVSPGIFIPTPETYVRHALDTVGKTSWTFGYVRHAVQGTVLASVPEWVMLLFIKRVQLVEAKMVDTLNGREKQVL